MALMKHVAELPTPEETLITIAEVEKISGCFWLLGDLRLWEFAGCRWRLFALPHVVVPLLEATPDQSQLRLSLLKG